MEEGPVCGLDLVGVCKFMHIRSYSIIHNTQCTIHYKDSFDDFGINRPGPI